MKKLGYIDSLRGLAILGVILVHSSQYGLFNVPALIGNIVDEGAHGVQLFYMASAFTLFLSSKNRMNRENNPVRNFFIRRFFRIAPMYYLGICYYLFQNGTGPSYWLGDATHISVWNIASNFLFLHGFNPYWINSLVPGGWSIGVEMTFYLIVPLLFLRIKNINQAFILFIGSLLFKYALHLILSRTPLISSEVLWGEFLFLYFPSQLPIFCLGIILYFLVYEKVEFNKTLGVTLLLFSLIILANISIGTNPIFPKHILFGIGFLALGLGLSQYQNRILVNPIINHIGKVSFSMYLVHFAVLYWMVKWGMLDFLKSGILNYVSKFLIVTIITVGISTILYNLIEVPFQKLGKKLIELLENKVKYNNKIAESAE